MRSDPIADMLTRIRNASRAEHEKVDIPASKLKLRVAELLKDEGFIKNFRLLEDPKQGTLRVYLKYGTGNEKMISGIVRRSEEHTSELQSRLHLVCRLLLEKKNRSSRRLDTYWCDH